MAYFGRGPNKIQNPYTLKDVYKVYMEDVGSIPIYQVEYNEYVNIIKDFTLAMLDHMFEEAGTFDLGFRLGKCRIIKKHYLSTNFSRQPVDWKLTNKLGKKIYNLNDHTRGYRYGFYWDRDRGISGNISGYRLVFTRDNKRKLARLIKSGKYDYYEKK